MDLRQDTDRFKVTILTIEEGVKPILSVTPNKNGEYTWTQVELMKNYLDDWWACSNCENDPMEYIRKRMQ